MGWVEAKLGDIAEVGAGNSAPQDEGLFINGSFPFFRTSDVGVVLFGRIFEARDLLNEDGIKKLKKYSAGDILIPKSGASTFLNHRVMLGVDGYVSSHLAVVSSNKKVILPEYLLYFLSLIKAQDLIQNHSYPSLKLTDIKNIDISFPPIPEQQRIVAILDQAFAEIEKARANAEQNLKNARELFDSYLQQVFSQRGEGWVEETLKDVCSLITCGVASTPKYVDESVGIPFLSAQNVKDGKIKLHKYRYISKEFHEKLTKKNKPERGDILYSRVGAGFGDAAVVDFNFEFSVYVSLTLIKPKRDKLMSNFLKHLLNSPPVKKLAVSSISSSGVPNLNVKSVREFVIFVPSLATQRHIVGKIELIFEQTKQLENSYRDKLNSLDELKKSLLQKAFSGELTKNKGMAA
jgi:type I restriction enzyme, S subunit